MVLSHSKTILSYSSQIRVIHVEQYNEFAEMFYDEPRPTNKDEVNTPLALNFVSTFLFS